MKLNPKDEAREPYRNGEELLEAPFPRAAREFAEKTVDQTWEAYERCNRTLEAAVQTLAKSFDAAVQGAAAQRRNIFDIAQTNLNFGFDLAKSLAGASNLSEIVELQAAYWRKQFDALTTQAEEVRNRLFEFGTAKPKAVETSPGSIYDEHANILSRASQRKGSCPAAPAAEAQRRDRQGVEALPGPTVRPSVERQSRTRRKGAAEDKSKRLHRPTARVSAAEGGKRKPEPRPPAGPVAPPGVRPPDERQSGTPKKGAPQDEAQQGLPAEIKFGMLDGNAVRFTSLEAWWLVDGVWRPISPDEVLLNAPVMREARFNQLFPRLPRLPSNAFNADNLQN